MKIIPYQVYTGAENMRIDEDILEDAIRKNSKEPVFRLYGWSPRCVSLGRNQKDNFIDYKKFQTLGIDVVRRLTGGRALLHDDEITYSFVCPEGYLKNGENVKKSYVEISQILIDGFKKLGIELDFGGGADVRTKFDYCMLISTGADLCYKGRKFIGSAQCRKNSYILQHGSILYDYDRELLEGIFGEKVDEKSVVSLKEINPNLAKSDIINVFNSLVGEL